MDGDDRTNRGIKIILSVNIRQSLSHRRQRHKGKKMLVKVQEQGDCYNIGGTRISLRACEMPASKQINENKF